MRSTVAAACLFLIVAPVSRSAYGQTTRPANPPAATAVRPAADVFRDWQDNARRLRELLPSPMALADLDKRAEVAPVAIPLLWRAVDLAAEMALADPPTRERSEHLRYYSLAVLTFLDDVKAQALLEEARDSNLRSTARMGRDAMIFARWWRSAEDPAAQNKVLDDLQDIAKDNPKDDDVANMLVAMREEGAANDAVAGRIEQIVIQNLHGPKAEAFAEQFKAAAKLRSLKNKPLVLTGVTLDGKPFSSADLAGKVILVDFGATWCQPWRQQLTDLRKLYDDRASRGLAIITVLCDKNLDNIHEFLAREPLPWPVLRDGKEPEAFAAQYGVEMFPTPFLIDRKGVVRHVDGTGKLAVLAEELLQEPGDILTTRPASRPVNTPDEP